jgi:uncharacterized protein YjbJ (UPF0337 family)
MTTRETSAPGPGGTTGYPPAASQPPGSGTGQSTQEAAQQSAQQVAGTAKEQAQQVASEVTDQARGLSRELQSQVGQRAGEQRQRLAGTLHDVGDELRQMAERSDRSGLASQFANEAAGRVHDAASYVESHEPGEVLDGIRDFARRRPGTFLLAAAAAGVLTGRLTRGATASAKAGQSPSDATERIPATTATPPAIATTYPVAPEPTPAPTPAPAPPPAPSPAMATPGTPTRPDGGRMP